MKIKSKEFDKFIGELIGLIGDDKILIQKANAINKSLDIEVKKAKANIEYNKLRNINKKIDLFE